MAGLGIPRDQIAAFLGINVQTLTKHYARELQLGEILANRQVAKVLFQQAVGIREVIEDGQVVQHPVPPDIRAGIFWAKARMKWSERVEVTGANGAAIQHQHTHQLADNPAERIKARIDRLAQNLPLLPPMIEQDIEETRSAVDAGEDE